MSLENVFFMFNYQRISQRTVRTEGVQSKTNWTELVQLFSGGGGGEAWVQFVLEGGPMGFSRGGGGGLYHLISAYIMDHDLP